MLFNMCSRILSLTIVCALIATAISHQSFQNGPRFVQQGPAINYQKPNIPQQVLPRGAQTQGFAPQQVVPFRPQLVARGACTAIGGCGSSPAMDFNQLLLGGSRGYAGMKARVNARGFQYASSIIGNLLNDEIRRAKIPAISQCIKEVNGCIQIYNIFVSRYRCPERIAIYPAPPNRIVISVQNLDIGITGNLGGQIIILVPIRLSGIVQMNAHRVSITTELVIERSATGSPYIRVASCNVQLGYVDAYLENAGLIGDIVNSQFRQRVSSQVRQMIPGQLCGQLPQIVNEKLNAKLTGLPQSLSLLQIKDTIVGMMSATPGHCAAPTCAGLRSAGAKQEIVPLPAVSQQPALIQPPVLAQQSPLAQPQFVQQHPQLVQATQQVPQQMAQQMPQQMAQRPPQYPRQHSSAVAHGQSIRYMSMPVNHPGYIYQQQQHQRIARAISFAMNSESIYQLVKKAKLFGSVTSASNPCSGCPGGGVAEDPLTQAGKLLEYLDWNKVSNLDLTLQLLNTYATSNDFTVEVNGEFSPGGQGGTPFGPFPLQFPYSQSDKMVDAVISDFTLNSLFYHAHRAGFFSVRLDSKTPKLGSLLKTSCGDDDETGLEDHGVETDEEATRRRRFKMLMRGVKTVIENSNHHHQERRVKRAEGDDALAGLGVCFGDILPQIRETYPNKNLVVNIRTTTAPSVLLSALNGGSVTAYLDADAEIFIDGNNPLQRVGTISISAIVTANLRAVSSKLMGSLKITKLTLKDKDGTLGLPADALVNLAALGKDLLEKAGNDILSKGLTISIPANTGLPIDIVAPQIQIVEHGVYLAADFTINPLALSSLTSGGASQGGCRRYLF